MIYKVLIYNKENNTWYTVLETHNIDEAYKEVDIQREKHELVIIDYD